MFSMPGLLSLLALAILPLVSAQSSSGPASNSSPPPSAQITVITSLSTSIGFQSGTGRVQITSVATIISTSTIQPTQSAAPTSDAGSASSAASSTTTANLPTGTISVVTDQAPVPGATGGPYGPDDSYINAAHSLKRNTLLLGSLTAVVGFLAI
ncbi:hypothetical protein B0H13DRAFT_2313952 [Mycena leptocephala]|nr:hypothetical protein B0H13DRAFT_2313952 [Mycena leptocephala]